MLVAPIRKREQHARPGVPPHGRLSPARPSAGQEEPRARSGEENPDGRSATTLGSRLCGRRARGREVRSLDHAPTRNRLIPGCREAATGVRGVPLFAVVAVALLVLATAACGDAGRGDAPAADAKARQETGGRESASAAETTAAARGRDEEPDKAGAPDGGAGARAVGGAAARAGKAGARVGQARADAGSVAVAGSRGGAGGKTDPKRLR